MSGLLTPPAEGAAPARAEPTNAANGAAAAERTAAAASPRDSLPLRLAAFAALAAFGAAHWAGLVAGPPQGRTLLLVVFVTAGAALLGSLRALPGRVRFPLAAVAALAMLAGGLVIAGLEARLLLPGNWEELADGLDRGLGGIQIVNWPYGGDEAWIRRTILLGAPLLLALAAATSFWPIRGGSAPLRAAGLVTLLVLYGTAVTEHDPGQPVVRGLLLLLLVAAWLWLPRLEPREALTGAAAVLAVGMISIPLSIGLDADRPWWDYRAWNWFGGGETVVFDWSHTYGPLDWPRDGRTLLNIRSDDPQYWKMETLDRFDGFRWLRSGANQTARPFAELPGLREGTGGDWDYFEFNPRWDERFRVTVRGLETDRVAGAGTTYETRGAGSVAYSGDGTTRRLDQRFEEGDGYRVSAYVPDPSAEQMRNAPAGYPSAMSQYTSIFLPQPGETAIDGGRLRGDASRSAAGAPRPVTVPLRGEAGGGRGHERRLLGSPYGRMYRLARRLTDGQVGGYEAARAVQQHLRRAYTYAERVPTRPHPLPGFLFQDRSGYCQQFSGAMALLLRMSGIPSRVVTGFAPGSYNRDTREYRVRDLDAHSWVEVYFTGIGWVVFDPTPPATPAQGRPPSPGVGAGLGGNSGDAPGGANSSDRASDPSGEGGSGAGPAWWLMLAIVPLLAAGAAGALALRAARERRSLSGEALGEAQLGELRRALSRLGWALPADTTLLGLERRLRRAAGPAAARYAAALRAYRFEPRRAGRPTRRDRRALRRELGAIGGLRGRVRALLALPPGRF